MFSNEANTSRACVSGDRVHCIETGKSGTIVHMLTLRSGSRQRILVNWDGNENDAMEIVFASRLEAIEEQLLWE